MKLSGVRCLQYSLPPCCDDVRHWFSRVICHAVLASLLQLSWNISPNDRLLAFDLITSGLWGAQRCWVIAVTPFYHHNVMSYAMDDSCDLWPFSREQHLFLMASWWGHEDYVCSCHNPLHVRLKVLRRFQKHSCSSVFMRTFLDVLYYPAPYLNHPN